MSENRSRQSRLDYFPLLLLLVLPISVSLAGGEEIPRSERIGSVLRQPLPPEDLSLSVGEERIVISGPTFAYTVNRGCGVIEGVDVRRGGRAVVSLSEPAQIQIDDYRLGPGTARGVTEVDSASPGKVVLKTTGELLPAQASGAHVTYKITSTFYSDGVVVSELVLLPSTDLSLRRGIRHSLELEGAFQQYLHKVHSRHNGDASDRHLGLPQAGEHVSLRGSTSCLQVLSHEAAVATFTDLGGLFVSPPELETASLQVRENTKDRARVTLTQHVVSVGPEGKPYVLGGGREFRFRVGISVAPNRHPHPRGPDLRHFVWIGDGNSPYPTDDEIDQVARLGFTVFQMHRLGQLGQPRPPEHELERVIKKVHDAGMLFVWLTLPDLIDSHSQRVQQMRAAGEWPAWEASHYGGHYVARMDAYCDWFGICIGAPNGLADYHLECAAQMMDRYDVDGIYLDDNIARGGACRHWQLHGHPREGYDCLIELHEVNWRRRQLLLQRRPHALLIDHCATGLVLPLLCDFEIHLYGEGAGSSPPLAYWNFYGAIRYMDAHGNIWSGDTEDARFGVAAAYNLDLLTGGGQYCFNDWRLFPEKFPYAAGVVKEEVEFVRTFNLAQSYFGMYESEPYYFATSQDLFSTTQSTTFATVYRNRVWNDYLIPIASANPTPVRDSLVFHAANQIGLEDSKQYIVYDVIGRSSATVSGAQIHEAFRELAIPAQGLRLFYVRPWTDSVPFHLWGGKRLEEQWNPERGRLTVKLLGPPGLKETVLIALNGRRIAGVIVNGQKADFQLDRRQAIAQGTVEFKGEPIVVEAVFGNDEEAALSESQLTPLPLAEIYGRAGQQ